MLKAIFTVAILTGSSCLGVGGDGVGVTVGSRKGVSVDSIGEHSSKSLVPFVLTPALGNKGVSTVSEGTGVFQK